MTDLVTIWRNDVKIFSGRAGSTQVDDNARMQSVPVRGAFWYLATTRWADLYAGIGPVRPPPYYFTWANDYFLWKTAVQEQLSEEIEVPDDWPAGLPNAEVEIWPFSHNSNAAMLAVLLKYQPHACVKWDYSGDKPVMDIVTRGNVTRTLDYSDGMTCTLDPHDDLVPDAIELLVQYGYDPNPDPELRDAESYQVGAQRVSARLTIYPHDYDGPNWRVLSLPVSEYQLLAFYLPFWWSDSALDYVLTELQQLLWEGEIVLQDGCNTEVEIGDTINITGGNPRWESMNATVQGITRNWLAQQTTLRVGPTLALESANFFELWINWARWRGFRTDMTGPPKV